MNISNLYVLPLKADLEKNCFHIIVILIVSICLYVFANMGLFNDKNSKEIPTPGYSFPYVGHLLSLRNNSDKTIEKWHYKLGPIIKLRFGVQTWISVSEPNLAHKILASLGSKTSFRYQTSFIRNHYSIGEKGIVFSQPGGNWEKSRSSGLSVLSPRHIEKYNDYISWESSILVDNLINATEKDYKNGISPFDAIDFFAINITTKIGFGKRFISSQESAYKNIFNATKSSVLLGGITNNLSDFLPVLSIVDYFFGKEDKRKHFIETQRNPVYQNLIEEARFQEDTNFIKILEKNDCDLSEDELIVMMSDFTIAGSDSIAVVLLWNIAIMCRYPEVQKKASTEIDSFIKTNRRLPSFNERLQLPYSISVIKECMRHKPNLPFDKPREVREDIEINGYIIRKNSVIISSISNIHTDSGLYHNPKEFIPERYMNNLRTMQSAANGRIENRDHFNFGWGRRNCPGSYLAEMEIFSVYVAIFARCTVEPSPEGIPYIEEAVHIGLNNWPRPFKVKFTKRSDSLLV